MMGWAMLGLVAALAVAFLTVVRFPWRMWTVAATGLTLGAAGYAWQGSPSLAGHPVSSEAKAGEIDPDLVALREAMFGKFGTNVFSYATAAETMIRTGRSDLAAMVWLGAVRKAPEDGALWTGLGLATAERDGNQVSPAANFAFEKAEALYPTHPGPYFFHGVALVRQGRFAEAKPLWIKAVQLTPGDASYREALIVRLFLLERYLAAQKAAAPQR